MKGIDVRIDRNRRLVVAVAVAAVLGLSGCGSEDEQEAAPSPSASTEESPDAAAGAYAYDTTFSGDDLLADEESSVDIPGTSSSITWRFPGDFLDDTETTATDPDNEDSYISLSADLDTDLETAVSDLMQRYEDLEDAVITSSEVKVGDQDGVAFSVVREGDRSDLLVAFAVDDTTIVAVNYSSADPAEKPTPETVQKFNQMVGSVALR